MEAAVAAVPYFMAASAAYGAYSQYQQGQYQSAVAQANANLVAEQSRMEQLAASEDMADRDMEARAAIAEMVSEAAASGLTATSGTMLLRREGAQRLAGRDRDRLALKRDVQRYNRQNEEASLRAEASAAKKSSRMALLGGLLDIPTSFLSGASMVNDYNRGQQRLRLPSYAR